MQMTFEQYILNPMGKYNAVLNATTRELIRNDYISRFDKLLVRENGRVDYQLYKDEKKNTYWIYAKIPSETVRNFYYDVVIEFYTDQKVKDAGQDLLKYYVRFYSNDPSFVYTYAHTFIEDDLFIDELKSKMSKQAIKENADIRNPGNTVNYVKTIYFAYLLIRNKALNNKKTFEANCKPLDIKQLRNSIEDADDKIFKRQEEGKRLEKQKPKKQETKNTNSNNRRTTGKNVTRSSRVSKTTNKSRSVGFSRNVKNTIKTK